MMDTNKHDQLAPLPLEPHAQYFLFDIARWGKFLSIVGFVGCFFFLMIGFSLVFNGSQIPNLPLEGKMGYFYMVYSVIYFFPCLYLFRFSNEMKSGLEYEDTQKLTTAIYNLKLAFQFIGILTIIGMVFIVIGALFAGSMLAGLK